MTRYLASLRVMVERIKTLHHWQKCAATTYTHHVNEAGFGIFVCGCGRTFTVEDPQEFM